MIQQFLLGSVPRRAESRRLVFVTFMAALLTVAKRWKQPMSVMEEWTNKVLCGVCMQWSITQT